MTAALMLLLACFKLIGKTTATGPDEDLSVDVLKNDLVNLLRVIFPNPTETPSLLVRS